MRTLSNSCGVLSPDQHHLWVQAHHNTSHQRPSTIPPPTPENTTVDVLPAVAFVEQGHWGAECPDLCGGAVVIEPGWLFMCPNCANAVIGGKWRPVLWPSNVRGIERTLAQRHIERFRNWRPGERIKHLERETRALQDGLHSQDPNHPIRRQIAMRAVD